MKITIHKLFNKYNYHLKLDKKLNIIVGENGVGKSTVLRIINDIVHNDLTNLAKIEFEKISLTILQECDLQNSHSKIYKYHNNSKKELSNLDVTIHRSDLIPNPYVYDMKFRIMLFEFLNKYNFEEDILGNTNSYTKFYDEFINYCEINKSNITTTIDPYDSNDYLKNDFKTFFNRDIETIDFENENGIELYYYGLFNNLLVPFGSKIYLFNWYTLYLCKNIIRIIDDFKEELIINSNLVNDSIYTTLYINNLSYVYSDDEPTFNCYFKKSLEYICTNMEITTPDFKTKYPFINLLYNNKYYKYLSLLTLLYKTHYKDNKLDVEYLDYVNFKEVKVYKDITVFTKLSFERYISGLAANYINNYGKIKKSGFSNFDRISINNIKQCFNKYGLTKTENCYTDKLIRSFSHKKIAKKIKEYIVNEIMKKETVEESIMKLFDNNLLIDCLFNQKTEFTLDEISRINMSLIDILNLILMTDQTIFHTDKKAIKFYELTKKYFNYKKFRLYNDDENILKVYIYDKRTNQEIPIDCLSSGEYKMLRLIKYMAFGNSNITLLDEPELSLSLFWQSMLINDILENTTSNLIVIATQSPYLIDLKNSDNIKEIMVEDVNDENN